jgi:hypothetical protein
MFATDWPQAFGSGGVSAPGSAGGSGAFSTAGGGAPGPAGLADAGAAPHAPQALPQAPVAQALPQGLLHGAQWLAHWIGAAWQHVAAGAHVEQDAV